jgi:hypothetical protein
MTEVRDQSNELWLAAYEGKPTAQVAPGIQETDGQQTQSKGAHREAKKDRFQQKKQVPKIVAPDEMSILIPEGGYAARCDDFTFADFWSSSKLVLKFEISEGRYSGTRLECYYNLSRKKNEPGEFEYVPSKRGSYLRMMRQAFAVEEQSSGDWLSPENLLGKSFRVEVVTVIKNHAREELGSNQYSKIKTNIELLHE